MNPDCNDVSDLPAPFADAWKDRTPLRVWNVNGSNPIILKAPDTRGAAALAAHLSGYHGGLDLVNAGTDHLGAWSKYRGDGFIAHVRPLDRLPAPAL